MAARQNSVSQGGPGLVGACELGPDRVRFLHVLPAPSFASTHLTSRPERDERHGTANESSGCARRGGMRPASGLPRLPRRWATCLGAHFSTLSLRRGVYTLAT